MTTQITDPISFIQRCWEIAFLGAAAAETKVVVAKNICAHMRYELQHAPENEKAELNEIRTRWVDLRARLSWARNAYCTGRAGGYGYGIRPILQQMWEEACGRDISELRDFEEYRNVKLWTPITFSEKPPVEIENLENDYTPFDDNVLVASDWKSQYIEYFDQTIEDNWKMIGSVHWLDTQFAQIESQVWDSSIDRELFENCWALISHGGKDFFHLNRSCMAQTVFETHVSFDDIEDTEKRKLQTIIHGRFVRDNADYVTAEGGCYMINVDKLPQVWQDKITELPASLKY